jgi:hypothetical protein
MAEGQAGLWAQKQGGARDVSLLAWPVVTIAREPGDRDSSLGRNVARRLGFRYWDHGTVMELVCHLHADRVASFKFDKRIRDVIETLLGTETPKGEVVLADYADELRLVGNLVIRRGGVVVDGRGAQLLVDPANALRVRLVTPFELRARRVEARDGIALEAAERLILSGDTARASFVLGAMGYDPADPATFDIIINAATYSGERALGLVLMAYFAKLGNGPLTAVSFAGGLSLGTALELPTIQPLGPMTGCNRAGVG